MTGVFKLMSPEVPDLAASLWFWQTLKQTRPDLRSTITSVTFWSSISLYKDVLLWVDQDIGDFFWRSNTTTIQKTGFKMTKMIAENEAPSERLSPPDSVLLWQSHGTTPFRLQLLSCRITTDIELNKQKSLAEHKLLKQLKTLGGNESYSMHTSVRARTQSRSTPTSTLTAQTSTQNCRH